MTASVVTSAITKNQNNKIIKTENAIPFND